MERATTDRTGIARSARRRAAVAVAAMLAVVALVYAGVVVGADTFYLGDFTWTTTPQRAFSAAALRAGRLPDWDPYLLCGLPHAANPLAATFSPTTLLYFVLPMWHAASLELVLGFLGAALGVFVVARQLGVRPSLAAAAGVVFALSGPLAASPQVGVHGLAAGFLPWALAGALACRDDRWSRVGGVALAGAALALVLLSGEPELVTVGALLAATLVAAGEARPAHKLALVAAIGLAAAALAAAQLFPALAFQKASVRAAGIALDEAQRWSLHPARLVTWLWPYFFGKATPVNSFWGGFITDDLNDRSFMYASIYVGVATLPLAALGLAGDRRGRALGVVALGLLAVALGRFTPLFALLHHLPPVSLSRYPERYVLPIALVLAIGAARGAERLLTSPPPRWLVAVGGAIALASTALALGAARLMPYIAAHSPVPNAPEAVAQLRVDGVHAALVAGLLALVVALGRAGRLRPTALVIAIVALTAGDVAVTARAVIATRPTATLLTENPTAAEVRAILGDARLYRFWRVPSLMRQTMPRGERGLWRNYDQQALTLRSNLPLVDGLADAGGHSAARAQQAFAADEALGRDLDRFAPAASVRAIVAPWPLPPALSSRVADGRLVLRRTAARIGVALLEVPRALPLVRCETPSACTLVDAAPGRLHVRATLAAPETLTLAETPLPGWRARIDGADAPIARSPLDFLTVAVPAGTHEVTLAYRAPGLRAGVAVSALAWLALLAVAVTVARARRRA